MPTDKLTFPQLTAVRSQKEAPQAEEEILSFWREHEIFRRSVEERPADRRFVFFEGPPTANNSPGVHHAISRLMKDLFCRYWTMKGCRVTRKAGWDTHGLPVEIEVEKELGLEGKDQIEQYGIARFNKACRESVFRYEKEWRAFTERLGFWLDLDNAYITCTNEYIESVWSLLKNFWDRGLIYQGHKVIPYCPRCGTPLSSHEVSQGYRDVEDPSIKVRMRLRDNPQRSLLVWTTTPWTLISNVAVAVNPNETYVVVRRGGEDARDGQETSGDEELILAEARLPEAIPTDYTVVEKLAGSDLVGLHYEPLFTFVDVPPTAYRVAGADFVSLEEGTGLVHIAPAFGEDDFRLGQEEGLPVVRPVDERGRFESRVTPFAGLMVKEADPGIIDDLRRRGLLFEEAMVEHSYPFCWRCNNYLVYFARETWFIRTTQFREELKRQNEQILWVPREIGAHRFGHWIEGNVDWALSRDRFWGTPLNIWHCDSCPEKTVVGTIEELRALAGELPEPIDLHRPYVDDLRLSCPHCASGKLRRTPEVIDCWFDSGSMPYAQWHYPITGEDEFRAHFPAHFIAEAVDQTRGWFYSLLAISTLYSGESCYKSCLVCEHIQDERGRKMSKSLGNATPPDQVFQGPGADALRWYLAAVNPPWAATRFSLRGVGESAQKLLGTLRNVCTFFTTYAKIDEPDTTGWNDPPPGRESLDRWILSRLEGLVEDVTRELDGYQMTRAARAIQQFVVEELSNWYVRRSRRRFWRSEGDADKADAYHTLFWVLSRVSRLLAPTVPFVTEEIHQKLIRPLWPQAPDSIHLASFPEARPELRVPELEEDMAAILGMVSLGRAARMEGGMKVRQPLADMRALVPGTDEVRERLLPMLGIVREELNLKEVRLEPPPADGTLPEEDGLVALTEGSLSVLLDTRLTPELRAEGIARELVNKIQFMRKRGGFRVTDRVRLGITGSPDVLEALTQHEEFISRETLADGVEREEFNGELEKEWDINGEPATIRLSRKE